MSRLEITRQRNDRIIDLEDYLKRQQKGIEQYDVLGEMFASRPPALDNDSRQDLLDGKS
jgi:hypothetical protein